MACLDLQGFDHFATANINDEFPMAIASIFSSSITIGAFGRNSSGAARFTWANNNATMYLQKSVGASGATAILAFSFNPSAIDTTSNRNGLCAILDTGGTVQFSLRINSDGTISILRGTSAGTVLGTSAAAITLGSHQHIGVKVVLSTTVGTYDVYLNGSSVISGTGANTAGAATTTWNSYRLGHTGQANTPASGTWDVEDVYCCDGSGSTNNDFLGDLRMATQLPSTGNGTNASFTPSTGSDHGALVDESTPNTSDYNSSNTAGQRDTYNFPALGLTGTVKAVKTSLYVAKSDAGARTIATVQRISGTNYDGATMAPGTSFMYLSQVDNVSPATSSAWTTTEIDATETGIKLVA